MCGQDVRWKIHKFFCSSFVLSIKTKTNGINDGIYIYILTISDTLTLFRLTWTTSDFSDNVCFFLN